jgi:hypothetical protein
MVRESCKGNFVGILECFMKKFFLVAFILVVSLQSVSADTPVSLSFDAADKSIVLDQTSFKLFSEYDAFISTFEEQYPDMNVNLRAQIEKMKVKQNTAYGLIAYSIASSLGSLLISDPTTSIAMNTVSLGGLIAAVVIYPGKSEMLHFIDTYNQIYSER